MVWQTYKEKIKSISQQLIEIQGPITILNSIKPRSEMIAAFQKSKYTDIPKTNDQTYQISDLGFDPQKKSDELKSLIERIHSLLGKSDEYGILLSTIASEYLTVIDLLLSRGTKDFYTYSKKLYGSTFDNLLSDKNTVLSMSTLLYEILGGIKKTIDVPESEKNLSAGEAVDELSRRLVSYFSQENFKAEVSDGIIADAAAGSEKIKLRADATFSRRDIDIYEVHEGWVHVGTSINGRLQRVTKWLSLGPPRCTPTQEGLAVLMEVFTFRSSVERAQVINDRIIAISKAEDGANLKEIFEYFRTEGYSEEDCIKHTFRIFRGTNFQGGNPFTKDISYCKGFVENYNFIRTAIRANKPFLIPFLFAGKVDAQDIPLLYKGYKDGLVDKPKYLPPQFQDINGIAVWMSFSSFFNRVDLKSVQAHFGQLFKKYT